MSVGLKHSLETGFVFGLTSGIITTLGLMVGLHSGTHSETVIIGGILTIAIADAFSDALGIHVSEETENKHTVKEVWQSTVCTFIAKFVTAMTFLVPVLLLSLDVAIVVSVAWGLLLQGVASFYIARQQGERPFNVVAEHVVIILVVVVITHYVGDWIGSSFGA